MLYGIVFHMMIENQEEMNKKIKDILIDVFFNFNLNIVYFSSIKILYRIEILLEFLENDYIFNPTKEQKELINNLHDCKVDLNSYIKDVKKRLLELNSNLSTN